MKHPALARVFSIVLAILSLIMLVNGSLGFNKIASALQDSMDKYQRLEDKTTEYESLTAQLENTISYDEAYAALEAMQTEHDSDAAQHRTDLATHTATMGGYTMAVEVINASKVELEEAKEQLAEGKAELEAQETQFNQLLTVYDAAAPALKLAAENASEGELEYQAALYSIDLMLYQIDTLLGNETQPPEFPALPTEPDEDASEETKLAYAAAYEEYEAAYSGYEAEHSAWEQEYAALQSAIAADLPSVDQAIQSGNDLINAAIGLIPDDMLESIGSIIGGDLELGDIADMDLPQIRSYLAQARAYLAASGNLSKAVNGLVTSLETQMEQGKQAIATAKYQVAVGEVALVNGQQELQHQLELLWYNMGQLDDETADLEESKQRLDSEAELIAKQLVSVDEQKELEQKQRSARIILMKEDGIKEPVNAGSDLADSAKTYVQSGREAAQTRYSRSFLLCILAIVGGSLGILSIFGSFEIIPGRAVLLIPTALCLACSVAAELLNYSLNSAQMYTATFVIIAAVLHMIFIIPTNKKAV